MTNQPEWKLIANLGDQGDPLNFGGVFVYVDNTGIYTPELEVWIPDDVDTWDSDEDALPGTRYRFGIEKCTYWNGILSDNKFHPEHHAWWEDKLEGIARSIGQDVGDLIDEFCSHKVPERALAYHALGLVEGFDNLDLYPLHLNAQEAKERYRFWNYKLSQELRHESR